jgi:hypothetical protein
MKKTINLLSEKAPIIPEEPNHDTYRTQNQHKHVLKLLFFSVVIILSMFGLNLVMNTFSTPKTLEPTHSENVLETGPDTFCSSDADCWCRSFTGAEFEQGITVQSFCSTMTNRCMQCVYK